MLNMKVVCIHCVRVFFYHFAVCYKCYMLCECVEYVRRGSPVSNSLNSGFVCAQVKFINLHIILSLRTCVAMTKDRHLYLSLAPCLSLSLCERVEFFIISRVDRFELVLFLIPFDSGKEKRTCKSAASFALSFICVVMKCIFCCIMPLFVHIHIFCHCLSGDFFFLLENDR